MRFRTPLRPMVISALAVVTAGASAFAAEKNAVEKPVSGAAARFAALKKLAGDWVKLDMDGKPTGIIASSIRVTAGGSVVEERLLPGTRQEMVTMYHMDGSDLVLTHYCALGNQPRMKLDPQSDATHLRFLCVSTGNVANADEMHMDRVTITLRDADHFSAEWGACKDGKPCYSANFNLERKK